MAGGAGQGAVFAEALAAFAGLRGIPCPDPGPAGVVGPDAVVLVVHAAALLAVLDAEAGTGGSGVAGVDALAGVLRHERRYWQQSLERRVPGGLDPDVIDRVVAAGYLIGADDQDAAMGLLAAVPDLAGDGRLRGSIARWLRDLYPAPDGGAEWLGQLQPDLLAERLAVAVLGAHPELVPRLFAGLSPARAVRALTVLARAALAQPAALPLIRQALHADPGHLLVPAVAVTTATNPALADLIMSVHAAVILPAATLIAVAEAIPYPTVVLAALNAAVTREILSTLPRNADPAERASRLSACGIALYQLGRPAEALPVTQEAVTIRRELAAASPDRYRPDLARSLSSLATILAALGRTAEAEQIRGEAAAT